MLLPSRIHLVFVVAILLALNSRMDCRAETYSFDDRQAVSELLETWYGMATDEKAPIESRRHAARDTYALFFEFWMVTIRQGQPPPFGKYGPRNILRLAARYADVNDPMSLLPYYSGDTLNSLGVWRARSYPMAGADAAFAKKDAYQKFVAEFLLWSKAQ
jgi:hypothetical protein